MSNDYFFMELGCLEVATQFKSLFRYELSGENPFSVSYSGTAESTKPPVAVGIVDEVLVDISLIFSASASTEFLFIMQMSSFG